MRSEDLAGLSSEMRADLVTALVSVDPTRIAVVIKRVGETDPAIAAVLQQVASRLMYSTILEVLRRE